MHYRTRRRSLVATAMPFRHRDGGTDTGNANPGGGGGGGGGGADGGTGGGAGGTDAGGKDAGGKTPTFTGDYDPDKAARALASARDGETKAKQAAQAAKDQHQKTLDNIAVALGFKPDPKTDPTALVTAAAKERDDARAEARARSVELAVYRAAGKASANADALLDSRSFLRDLADLDPAAKDFDTKVAAAIADAVTANPAYGNAGGSTTTTTTPPARSGGEFTGGSGAGAPITEEQLAKMTPDQISKAYEEGRLKHLL